MMMSLQEIVLSGSVYVVVSLSNVVLFYCSFMFSYLRSYSGLKTDIKKTYDCIYSLWITLREKEWSIVDNIDPALENVDEYMMRVVSLQSSLRRGLNEIWLGYKVITCISQVSNIASAYYFDTPHTLTLGVLWGICCTRIMDKSVMNVYTEYVTQMMLLNVTYNNQRVIDDDVTIINVVLNDDNTSSSAESHEDDIANMEDVQSESSENTSFDEYEYSERDNTIPYIDPSGLQIDGLSYEQCRDIHVYWMRNYVLPEFNFSLDMIELAQVVNHEILVDDLHFQGSIIQDTIIEVNQKNIRRKHFRDKKAAKNNKDMDNAKAALRFLKQAKASNSEKYKVTKAIEDTKRQDPKLHKEIMKEVRGKLDFHGSMFNSLASQYVKSEVSSLLGLTYQESFQKYMEGLILLVVNALQCTTWTHFMTTILAYISAKVDKTLYSIIYEYLTNLFKDDSGSLEFQASFVDRLKEVSGGLKTGLSSGFSSKIFSFMGLLTTLSLTSYLNMPFKMEGYFSYIAAATKAILVKGDVLQQLIEHSIYFYEKGMTYFKTKDLCMVFYDIEDANAYQLEFSDLKAYEYLLDSGCLEEFGTSVANYSQRIEELLLKTDTMLKGCKDDRTRSFMGAKKQSLLVLRYKLLVAFRKMSMRIKPYTVLLAGESGVGKTVAKDLLIQVIAGSNPDYFTLEDMIVSSINDDDQYMTEVTNKTQVLVVDDVGNTQPMYAEKPITKTVIHASNNEPKAIIKAKVEEKGAHYMNFNAIVMTTNKPDLHTKTYTVDPTSVLRRFEVHITTRIKEQYRKSGSYMLDVTKTDGMEMDIWEFDIFRYYKDVESKQPKVEIVRDEYNTLMASVDLDTLLQFLSWDSKRHFARQKGLLTEHASIKKMKVCPHGSLDTVCKHPSCRMNFQSNVVVATGAAMYITCSLLARVYAFTNWLLMMCMFYKTSRRFLGFDISYKKWFGIVYACMISAYYSSMIWNGSVGLLSVFFGCFSVIPLTITGSLYVFSNKVRKDIDDISMTTWYKANKFYSSNKKLTNTLVAMGSVMSLYHMARLIKNITNHADNGSVIKVDGGVVSPKEDDVFQGVASSCLQMPKDDDSPRLNPYLVPVIQDVKVDDKVKTMTLEQALGVIKRNQAIVRTETTQAGIFPVCQNYFIINRHALGNGEGTLQVFRDGINQLGRNFKAKFSRDTWKRINNGDLCVIYLPNGGSQKDLRHMFPKEHTKSSRSCIMSVKNVDGSYESTRFWAHSKVLKTSHPTLHYDINTPALEYQADIPMVDGMCMSPVLSLGLAPFIIGFHCMGTTGGSRGVANQVTLDDLQGAINELEMDDDSIVFQSSSYTTIERVEPATGMYIDTMIDRKSAVNFLEKGTCHVYGTLNRPMTMSKTKVKDTFISKDVEELLGQPNEFAGPKLLNNWKPKHEELDAISNTADVNPRILTMAYKDLRNHYFKVLDNIPNWQQKVHPITNEANLAGCDGVYGVNSINLNTSTGFPLYTKKSKIIVHNPELEVEGISRPLEMSEEHWLEVEKAESVLASGERVNFIHTASTKDEPKKKDSEKVRVFYVTPLTCLLLCRRYFLMLAKLLMDYSLLFENTIGINVHSLDWDNVVEKLLIFGFDRFINGDFKKYDSKMPVMINLATFKLFLEISQKSGNFSEKQLAVMRGLATELCLPILNFFLTVLMVFGSTISGHSLTICLNSVDNSLIMRYAFYKIFENKYENEFAQHIVLFTNGDDNIMTVSPEIEGFNHTSVQAALAEDGIVYTMAEKEAESVPFIPLSDTSYLKRRFKYSTRYRRWQCPIEEKSIYKSLHNYIPSKVQSKEQHAVEVMNNALREYFYYGELRFEEVRGKLTTIVNKYNLSCEMPTGQLLTYSAVEESLYTN